MNLKFSTKLGAKQGASQKSRGAMGHPGSPLELPLGNTRRKHTQLPAVIWNVYYDAKKLLHADDCIMIASN